MDSMEYFSKKGAAEILDELSSKSSTYGRLEKKVDVSSATLSSRLEEAQELDLVIRVPLDHMTSGKVTAGYELSPIGEVIADEMNQTELLSYIEKKKELENKIQKIENNLQHKAEKLAEEAENIEARTPDELEKSLRDLDLEDVKE